MSYLTAEDLLAGAAATHGVDIPATLLRPTADATNGGGDNDGGDNDGGDNGIAGRVELRPLTVADVQRLTRAAHEQRLLTSVLMVQQAMVQPALTVDQVSRLPAGLVQYLLARVNRISGLEIDEGDLEAAVKAPLARACFVLAREFGWTATECSELTVGQILLYLEMLSRDGEAVAVAAGAPRS